MLPHNHFIIAGLVIAPVGLLIFPEMSASGIGEWICIGGLVSAAIDLDIYRRKGQKSRRLWLVVLTRR